MPWPVLAICWESAAICCLSEAAAERVAAIWLWRSPELGDVRTVPRRAASTATTARTRSIRLWATATIELLMAGECRRWAATGPPARRRRGRLGNNGRRIQAPSEWVPQLGLRGTAATLTWVRRRASYPSCPASDPAKWHFGGGRCGPGGRLTYSSPCPRPAVC